MNDGGRESTSARSRPTVLVGATDLRTALEAGLVAAALLAFSALMGLVSIALHRIEREETGGEANEPIVDSSFGSNGDRS